MFYVDSYVSLMEPSRERWGWNYIVRDMLFFVGFVDEKRAFIIFLYHKNDVPAVFF